MEEKEKKEPLVLLENEKVTGRDITFIVCVYGRSNQPPKMPPKQEKRDDQSIGADW